MNPVSYSNLTDFEGCPKRYYHLKILKSHKQVFTQAISYGKEVHKAVEWRVKDHKPLPPHILHIEPIIDWLERRSIDTVLTEEKLAVNRGWLPGGYWENPWIRGAADLMGFDGTTLYIFDWKTGKRRQDMGQLELYALMAMAHGIKRVRGVFIWLKTKEKDETIIDETNADAARREFEQRIVKLETAHTTKVWPAQPTPLCAYCPLVNECDEAVKNDKGVNYREKAKYIRR